mmetsp:Transcript_20990/g.81089  ORF Transcript_20990/g.81089 Transcript_20990/m.81089 type:complete len:387 (+) Transcript_20990:670-1830(+)
MLQRRRGVDAARDQPARVGDVRVAELDEEVGGGVHGSRRRLTCASAWTCRLRSRASSFPHQGALAKEGLDQVHRDQRGLVLLVQCRVQLHQVQAGHASGVVDHLHAQVGLAVGRAAVDRGAHARCHHRVEEVDVEADVQMGVVVQRGQGQLHRVAHAHFVDEAHVEDFKVLLVHEAPLALVDAADADLAHPLRADRGHMAADLDQLLGPEAAQAGHGHAVDVAAGGEGAGVEVGMGVQPQHAQLLAHVAAVAGHGADGAQAQAVVAAEQDGHAAGLELGVHRIVHGAVPCDDLVEVAVALHRRQPGVGGAAEVAAVLHVHAAGAQGFGQAGHAHGLGAHAGTAGASADVGGRADQGDVSELGHSVGVVASSYSVSSTAQASSAVST